MKVTLEEFLGLGENKMSKAKACDRCGEIYSVIHHKYKTPSSMIIKYGYDYGKDTLFETLDLCTNCVNDFMEFKDSSHK